MKLGENILKLRKKNGLSQEQLGDIVNVTRQTISNWELGETSPNPEQLKLLSKALNISVDELIDNEVDKKSKMKTSNTEKLTGFIIKSLKVIGILFIIAFIVDIIALILFIGVKGNTKIDESQIENIEMQCSIENNDYIISIGTDGYFNCSNCPNKLQTELKDRHVDFGNLENTKENISDYFNSNNGVCK